MTMAADATALPARRCFTPDLLFFANLLNLLLMALYVWADYGRGYLEEDPALLNGLYAALAFAYVADGALFLYAHEGELPWPSGFSMWSDWLSCAANAAFAVTACLYPRESSEAITTFVLVAEASASLVNGAAAICGLAGWWMESNKETAAEGCGGEAWGLLTSLDFWAHVTNFLPAVVYMGSSVAAAEINYARLDDLAADAGPVRLPELLRQLARVYWYGDILWFVNAGFWMALWVRDSWYEAQAEAEEAAAAAGAAAPEALAGGEEKGSSSGSSSSGSLTEHLLEGSDDSATPVKGGALAHAPSTSQRLHRERRKKRLLLRDTEPYHLFIPFLRWAYAVGGCWERYRALRGSHGVGDAAGTAPSGSDAAAQLSGSARAPLQHPPLGAGAPLSAVSSINSGSDSGSFSQRSLNGGGGGGGAGRGAGGGSGVVSGPRVLRLLAVSSLAANVESRRGAAAAAGGARGSAGARGGMEMVEMTERRRL
jgi:hypothetical protein